MDFKIEGVLPALLTPFTKGGARVDYEGAAALAVRLSGQGVHGLFVAGTTGEGLLLSKNERKQLLETVAQAVGNKLKVVAHTGCLDTATTIELTHHAVENGAVAAGIIAPPFFSYDDAALKRHFLAVAKAAPGVPIMLYNLPSCAKNVLTPDLVVDLGNRAENIVGLKDSGGDLVALTQVIHDAPEGFSVINGTDTYTYQAYLSKANGSVASTANVFPELFLDILVAVREGRFDDALATQQKLTAACGAFQYGAKVCLYKEALRLRGFDAGYVRSPQREATSQEKKQLAKKLESIGLI